MNPRKTLIVFSNESQFKACPQAARNPDAFQILCDDGRFHDYLKTRDVVFEPIDDFFIQDRWEEVNRWGCQKAVEWIRFCQERRFFKTIDFSSVLYYPFSRLLSQLLKNYYYAQKAMEWYRPNAAVLFYSDQKPAFPAYSSNFLLNYFLKDSCFKQNIPTDIFPLSPEAKLPIHPGRIYPKAVSRLLVEIKTAFRRMAVSDKKSSNDPVLLAVGSLTHLASTLAELKKGSVPLALVSDDFNFEQWRFASKNKMIYSVIPEAAEADPDFIKENSLKVRQALEAAAAEGMFTADGFDFGSLITGYVFSAPEIAFRALAKKAGAYQKLSENFNIAGILTDNDYAFGGAFLAAYYRGQNIPVYCISHANVLYDFLVDEKTRAFRNSFTFVNSEIEKQMYAARGWREDGLIVTGTPRYDRLRRMRRKTLKHKVKLLFCANTYIRSHTPDEYGYLGSDLLCYRDVIELVMNELLKALRGLPIELIIKPHSIEGIPFWKRFMKSLDTGVSYRITPRGVDFFALLRESDAMALYYWSTAAFETAICGIPNLFLDPMRRNSAVTARFAARGYCQILHDAAEIKTALEKIIESKNQDRREPDSPQHADYLGPKDGKNSRRAADFISESLRNSSAGLRA